MRIRLFFSALALTLLLLLPMVGLVEYFAMQRQMQERVRPRQCGGHGSAGRPGVPLYGQPVVGGAERGTRIYPAAYGCPCRHADSVRLARQHAACRPQRHHNAGRSLSGGWPGTGSSAAGGYPWYRPATLPCGHAQLLCQLLGAGHHRAAGYGRVAGGYRPPPELCGRNRGCHCRNRSA